MGHGAGVKDDGYPEGISEPELRESLGVLRAMAKGVSAAVKGVKTQKGVAGRLAQVVIRREKYRYEGVSAGRGGGKPSLGPDSSCMW